MEQVLQPVGIREAKNRFSELAAEVNACGSPLTVLKSGKPWVTICPADASALQRRERLARLRALTASIEQNSAHEPAWDERRSDKDYLGDERMERFG